MIFEHKKEINSFLGKYGFILIFLVLILFLGLVRFSFILTDAGDVSWLLYGTNEWLNGAKLYVDILETNPPLVFFIYAIPVSIADLIGVSYFSVFSIFTYLMILLTVFYCYQVLRYSFQIEKMVVRGFTVVLLLSLTLFAGIDFGQREHYFILFALPYILLAGLRLQGIEVSVRHASFVGIIAFFGFALKPYFFFIPVGLEILLLFKYKKILKMFRIETLILGTLVLAYVLFILFYTPEYLNHIYPLLKEVYANGYNRSLLMLFFYTVFYLIITVGLLFLVMWDRGKNRALSSVLVVSLLGCWLSYFVQQKGWYYHFYPALVILYVLMTFLFLENKIFQKISLMIQKKLDADRSMVVILFVLGAVFLTYTSVKRVVVSTSQHSFISDQIGLYKSEYKEKTGHVLRSFTLLGFFLPQGFPAVTDHQLIWTSRSANLWILRGILKKRNAKILTGKTSKPSAREKWAEEYAMQSVIEDISKFKPDLIIVSKEKWWHQPSGKEKLGLLDYFKQKEDFRKIWSHYKLDKSIKGYHFYRRVSL